jgi:hypothetical protein
MTTPPGDGQHPSDSEPTEPIPGQSGAEPTQPLYGEPGGQPSRQSGQGEPPYQQSPYQQSPYQQPAYGQPAYGPPSYGQPGHDQQQGPYQQQPGYGPPPGYGQAPPYSQPGQAQPGQPQPGYAQGSYGYVAAPDHPKATISLVLGILGLVACQVISPFAWVIGKRTVGEIDASQGRLGGRGSAQAGYILGIIGTVLLGLGLLVFVVWLVFVVLAIGTASTNA